MSKREWSERDVRFETLSGIPLKPVYTPEDVARRAHDERLGQPGEYPFTRGVYPTMYRGRLWTMRMFAGFGRPEDTNARFKYLLAQGQTGLSTAFDMPALMGYDADHPRARGEVGKEGVSISTLDDFERLFADIPLGDVTTSMTINCTASVRWPCTWPSPTRRGSAGTASAARCRTTCSRSSSRRRNGSARPRPPCGS